MNIFNKVNTKFFFSKLNRKDGQPNFITKAALGMAAGCVGAFVGTPAEVALIRMTADGRLPLGNS